MVSRCANPECQAPFLYLREGQLFATHRILHDDHESVEYFWLCGYCSTLLRVETALDGAMNLVPRGPRARQRAPEKELV